jgi:flavin reductase (DIM6/NTAB) family NADH-FMN oxidoreductase RutF
VYNVLVTIHGEFPFPSGEANPIRRFRGRMPAPVSIWTCDRESGAVGWTVSSFLLADGSPAVLVGLLDEDSDLATALSPGGALAVSLLEWRHRALADAFAQLAPAPGGAFRQGTWTDTAWGPVLADAAGWLGARVTDDPPEHAGWALLVRAVVEHVEVAADSAVLTHVRGRYHALPDQQ